MLEISGLGMSFDGFVALRDVALRLDAGEKHAVIGPNGAGKTTFFNCITGHVKPSMGSVRFKGEPITDLPPHRIVRLGIARSFQRINIYPRLSAFDNVQAALIAHHGRHFDLLSLGTRLYRRETRAALARVGLADESEVIAGLLAYGKQKQLELAIALASEPELLLLDEPTAGMSPGETGDIIALIATLTEERGLTLLFTEHDMKVVFSIADRISVLHHGEIIASDTPERVRANAAVQSVYLGGRRSGPS